MWTILTSPSLIPSTSSFTLSAYLNPFNATTQIRFDLPHSSHVEIGIYDITGRLVENLAGRMFEAGTHRVNYDASHHASGTYIVCLNSGEFSTEQKVILLK